MKYFLSCLLILLFIKINYLFAQIQHANDTLVSTNLTYTQGLFRSKSFQRAVIVPTILIASGLYASTDNDVINNLEVQEERNEWAPAFHHGADDYIQYAPIAAVYGLNILGIKGKNDLKNRTWLLIKTELLMGAMVYSLKKITTVPRPDTGQPSSFPSGHTAQAFAAATFMAKEYGYKSVWYSIGAYTVATGVGVMRVMNNRHWASDVLAGAGIGILSTNITYLLHRNIPTKRNKSTAVWTPAFNYGSMGACLIITIN
ncbi:MAG: phosphatase PAP2 family protein [Flammeovirgaceae bacterium]|nr:MAG: phosphatase PAP2 family protein [Flammeovirgaceae bacterium]